MRKAWLIIGFVVAICVQPYADGGKPYFELEVEPSFTIPVGESSFQKSFFGGTAGLGGYLRARILEVGVVGGYSFAPVRAVDGSASKNYLSIISGGAGLGLNIEPTDWLGLRLFARGGYFYTFLTLDDPGTVSESATTSGHNPWVGGGAGLSFRLAPAFSIGLTGSYRHFFGFRDDVRASIHTIFHIGSQEKSAQTKDTEEAAPPPEPKIEKLQEESTAEDVDGALSVQDLSFETIFPVFFKYYDDHPVGRATVTNTGETPLENVYVSFYVKQYMDNPKQVLGTPSIPPGEERSFDIYGLFTGEVLTITEGMKASANIEFEYEADGQKYIEEQIETVSLENRNAMTWEDDRRAAAFVTAKDPTVLTFAKNVSGITGDNRAVNRNVQFAIGLHAAISEYRMNYTIDPSTPYSELSEKESVVDFLQFPKQTLQYRAGDCDDLSIMYCALFEAVGIETAFVTVPGHIFMAFSTGLDPDQAKKDFRRPDELVFHDGTAWVPFEATSIGQGFLDAWQKGAKQWRENSSRDQARFLPVREAWKIYQAVGMPGSVSIAMPDLSSVEEQYHQGVEKFINREIFAQVSEYRAKLESSQNDPRIRNKLGVLYARYGLDDLAMIEFEEVLAEREYAPALLNAGNIQFLQGNPKEALSYYERAAEIRSDHPAVVLSLAKVHHELENYGSAQEAYDRLKRINPGLAARFAYLEFRGDEAARASDIDIMKETVVWDIEEEE